MRIALLPFESTTSYSKQTAQQRAIEYALDALQQLLCRDGIAELGRPWLQQTATLAR